MVFKYGKIIKTYICHVKKEQQIVLVELISNTMSTRFEILIAKLVEFIFIKIILIILPTLVKLFGNLLEYKCYILLIY